MALQLVDIFGNLQPDTGATPDIAAATLEYFALYKNYEYSSKVGSYAYDPKRSKRNIGKFETTRVPKWNDYFTNAKNNLERRSADPTDLVTKVNENTFQIKFKENKNITNTVVLNNLYVSSIFTQTVEASAFNTFNVKAPKKILGNVYINVEETDIFKRVIGNKLDCLYQIGKLKFGSGEEYLAKLGDVFLTSYFYIQTFYLPKLEKSGWEKLLLGVEDGGKAKFVTDYLAESKKNVEAGIWKKEDVPSCFLPDPDPALPGPPTQTISGVTNKAPTVDDPNIKLPTQEVKSLTATSATDAVGQAQTQATSLTSQAQGAVSSVTGQAQGAVSSVTGQAQGAVSSVTGQAQGAINNLTPQVGPAIKVDGLGNDWTPDKFQPSSIAGNTKYVDPKTGIIGSTSTLAKGLTGAVAGGALGAGIGALAGGGTGALAGGIGGAVAGTGVAIGGVTGGALAGAGLGAGVASIAGGNTATIVGAGVGGAALGAAVAKLNNIKSTMPKPNVPKPPNTPRIKTIKIPRPNDTKGAQALLNLPKSPTL